MVKHYYEMFENEEKPAGPVNMPPPLLQRLHNLFMDTKSTSVVTNIPKRVVHTKTMSDTGMYISSLNTSLSSSNINKTLSPKPSRIPLFSNTAQMHHTRQPPPLPPSNPRSKSVSSSSRNHTVLLSVSILKNLDEPDWVQHEEVGEIGKRLNHWKAIHRRLQIIVNKVTKWSCVLFFYCVHITWFASK